MIPRCFVDPKDITKSADGLVVVIGGDDAHHLRTVLRLRPGDEVVVADGDGRDYPGTVAAFEEEGVRIVLLEPRPSMGEPRCSITLLQGLPKGDKMDWVVQKAAEIGITTVVPILMERSVVQLTVAKAERRVERWQRIAKAAAQQAGRGRIPVIDAVHSLRDALVRWRDKAPQGLLLVPWEEERGTGIKRVLQDLAAAPKDVAIVIGPEGGLTDDEIALCREHGAFSCTLGPRILRTETAGTVVAALVLYEFGDMDAC